MQVSISVEIFNTENESQVIQLSNNDMSLESMLRNCGAILGTCITYDENDLLTDEENNLIVFKEGEEDELSTETIIANAKAYLKIFFKIYKKVYSKRGECLESKIESINGLEIPDEEKAQRRLNEMNAIFNFGLISGRFLGILQTAGKLNHKVKIIAEWY